MVSTTNVTTELSAARDFAATDSSSPIKEIMSATVSKSVDAPQKSARTRKKDGSRYRFSFKRPQSAPADQVNKEDVELDSTLTPKNREILDEEALNDLKTELDEYLTEKEGSDEIVGLSNKLDKRAVKPPVAEKIEEETPVILDDSTKIGTEKSEIPIEIGEEMPIEKPVNLDDKGDKKKTRKLVKSSAVEKVEVGEEKSVILDNSTKIGKDESEMLIEEPVELDDSTKIGKDESEMPIEEPVKLDDKVKKKKTRKSTEPVVVEQIEVSGEMPIEESVKSSDSTKNDRENSEMLIEEPVKFDDSAKIDKEKLEMPIKEPVELDNSTKIDKEKLEMPVEELVKLDDKVKKKKTRKLTESYKIAIEQIEVSEEIPSAIEQIEVSQEMPSPIEQIEITEKMPIEKPIKLDDKSEKKKTRKSIKPVVAEEIEVSEKMSSPIEHIEVGQEMSIEKPVKLDEKFKKTKTPTLTELVPDEQIEVSQEIPSAIEQIEITEKMPIEKPVKLDDKSEKKKTRKSIKPIAEEIEVSQEIPSAIEQIEITEKMPIEKPVKLDEKLKKKKIRKLTEPIVVEQIEMSEKMSSPIEQIKLIEDMPSAEQIEIIAKPVKLDDKLKKKKTPKSIEPVIAEEIQANENIDQTDTVILEEQRFNFEISDVEEIEVSQKPVNLDDSTKIAKKKTRKLTEPIDTEQIEEPVSLDDKVKKKKLLKTAKSSNVDASLENPESVEVDMTTLPISQNESALIDIISAKNELSQNLTTQQNVDANFNREESNFAYGQKLPFVQTESASFKSKHEIPPLAKKESDSFDLQIDESEPIQFTKELDPNIIGKVDEMIKLDVELSRPAENVKWLFNGKEIQSTNENFSIKASGNAHSIQINNPTFDLSGQYSMIADGVETSTKLDFHGKPVLDDSADSTLELNAKEELQLKCKFKSNPLPTVEIRLNDEPIDDQSAFVEVTSDTITLTRPSVTRKNSGVYTFIVSNTYGKAEKRIKVVVCGKYFKLSAILYSF
jgi:hypothetical protein